MRNEPLVSIGMPVYNGANFIKEAIISILSQTYEHIELIISDNASNDTTEEICQFFLKKDRRIKYYRNKKNIGAARNFNRVFQLSTGKYFKWASHDDIIAPTFIEKCVNIHKKEPNIAICSPSITYIDEYGKVIQEQIISDLNVLENRADKRVHKLVKLQKISKDIFWTIFGLISSNILRYTQLIGSYIASDQVLLFNLLLKGKLFHIKESLFFRREHPQASMNKWKTSKERLTWFDPDVNGKAYLHFAAWNVLYEHLKCVHYKEANFLVKLNCYFAVLKRFIFEWRTLAGELKAIIKNLYFFKVM